MRTKIDQEIEQFLRDKLSERMALLTEKQLALLHRIQDLAPWKGVDNIPYTRLEEVIEL